MKSTFFKLAICAIILSSFSLQSFSPCLPNVTTIKITDLYWLDNNNNHQDYYSAKVTVSGPIVTDPGNIYVTYGAPVSLPRTTEYFSTDYQYYYTSSSSWTNVTLYAKQTSNSSWQNLGSISSHSIFTTRYVVDTYLYVMEFSKGALPNE